MVDKSQHHIQAKFDDETAKACTTNGFIEAKYVTNWWEPKPLLYKGHAAHLRLGDY